MKQEKRVKVGIVGAGKRAETTHLPLLNKLRDLFEVIGFTTRSESTAIKFHNASSLKYFDSISSLVSEEPELLVCCVSGDAMFDVLSEVLSHGVPVLVETPIADPRLISLESSCNTPMGVFEQWPRLPLEQFKSHLYNLAIFDRPFLVKNDCRSFNYHAVAQLRNYLGRESLPISAYGVINPINTPAFKDNNGSVREENEIWDHGIVRFSNGAILSHDFSYHCKTAPFRSLQTLRAYSKNGTITTGKNFSAGDDFQILDFRCLEGSDTRNMDIRVLRNDSGLPIRIWDEVTKVYWKSEFKNEDLTEQEIAIASIYRDMREVIMENKSSACLYSCRDAYIDYIIMAGIQHSAQTGAVVSFNGS